MGWGGVGPTIWAVISTPSPKYDMSTRLRALLYDLYYTRGDTSRGLHLCG
jgi:hypothetical protein